MLTMYSAVRNVYNVSYVKTIVYIGLNSPLLAKMDELCAMKE